MLAVFRTQHRTLTPSTVAMGPNTYLGRNDFLKMLGVAFAVHVAVFGIAHLFPREAVTNIPVRALSFKLGDEDRVAAYAPAPTPPAAPVMQASTAPVETAPELAAEPMERVAAKPTPAPPKPMPKPQPRKIPTEQFVKEVQPKPMEPLPAIAPPAPSPAIAPSPQQYVREVGQPNPLLAGIPQGAIGGSGQVNTQTEQTTETIRERYEQQISAWIQRHKIYPAGAAGAAGRVVVRMRIDRAGTVRYYALEQSSGNNLIDAAAVDMVRRANPVPAVPANYPAGNLIEFLIPISFEAPQ